MLRRSKHTTATAVIAPALPPQIEQAAKVEIQLADARRDLEAAEAEVEAARAAYELAADGARVSEAVAARSRILEAETVADIASRKAARLDEDLRVLLAGAADAAAAAEREQLRVVAQQALGEYAAKFQAHMPEITAKVRGLIRLYAQAELAREAAAAAGVLLPRADAFRDITGMPRVEISRVEHDLWLNPYGGAPYGDGDQAEIRTNQDGSGSLHSHNYTHRPTRKRRYADITFRPAVPGQKAPALYEVAVLPCVEAGGPAGWAPLRASTTPWQVLEALDALEARQDSPRAEPEQRTEREPIEPARDVRISQDPAPYREYRGPYGSLDDAPADEHAGT